MLFASLRVLVGTLFFLGMAATVGIPAGKRGPVAAPPSGEPLLGLDLYHAAGERAGGTAGAPRREAGGDVGPGAGVRDLGVGEFPAKGGDSREMIEHQEGTWVSEGSEGKCRLSCRAYPNTLGRRLSHE